MENIISPITGSANVLKMDSFKKAMTSEQKFINEDVSNYFCQDTGLVFNQTGARGKEDWFYEEEYDLHSENDISEFKYQTDQGYIGIYENIVQFLQKNMSKYEKGNILDIGCGKGLLLKNFSDKNQNWRLYGIEPSKNASLYHERLIPEAEIYSSSFDDVKLSIDKFQIVVSNGVLEHVPKPLDFLSFIYDNLDEDGICFIGVPNFKNNPIDIYTYDHLSRFTPETIKIIFTMSGFKVIDEIVSENRVPMWFIIKKTEKKEIHSLIDVSEQLMIYKKNLRDLYSSFNSIVSCINDYRGDRIVVYGTGSVFAMSTLYNDINFNDVECYIDDNDTIHGTTKMGLMVNDPSYIEKNHINKIIISSNPCYHSQIMKRINMLKIQSPKLFY